MVCPAIHAISHLALDTIRIGPGIIYSQWLMERMIGILGGFVTQPSNPYANLAQRLIRLAQVNALKAMDPSLRTSADSFALPRGAVDIGNGYTLRRAKDTAARSVTDREMAALRVYLREQGFAVADDFVLKIARSRWKEELKPINKLRMARNVQLTLGGNVHVAEVHYYMILTDSTGTEHYLAVGSFYGAPHAELYKASQGTYISMPHARDKDVRVFSVTCISSVVMMAPDPRYGKFFQDGTEDNRYFMMSKPGVKTMSFIGIEEDDIDD
ncbi:hypothetical protein V5O48_016737 [Marasmius crinis-equi]|uniref:Uncharacterized protein n=1 Tax=Marasmius crinis-equi TaxID=585013 RepID=A0ABR3EQV3_9AGAR